MRIAAILVAALLASAVGGLGVASTIASGYHHLRDLENGAKGDSAARARLKGFRRASEQLLLTGDLLIGSEVGYLAPGVAKQLESLELTLDELRHFSLLSEDSATLDGIGEALELIRASVNRYSTARPETAGVLEAYDGAASRLVILVDELDARATRRAADTLQTVRTEYERQDRRRLLLLAGYSLMMLLLLFVLLRHIADPVRKLTISAEDAMELRHRFRPVSRGPLELRRLGGTIFRFVAELEDRVAQRTRILRKQTEELEAEIEGRRRAEIKLRAAMVAAEAASKAKSEFLSVMSHELRTPMNAVLGTLTLIEEANLADEQRLYIETARDSGNALMSLLNDVLDMSKIEAGQLQASEVRFDLFETVNDVLSLFHPKCCEKSVVLAGILSPDVPRWVIGDPLRIRQVLTNLVGNAVKFTDDGHIHVSVTRSWHPENADMLNFTVADTGEGIPQADQAHVFDRFSQVDKSDTRHHGGTGLGLSISKRLVEIMGGEIGITSVLGSGSEFSFAIPLPATASASDTEPGEATLTETLAGTDVVITGSCEAMARSLRNMLSDWVGSTRVETSSRGLAEGLLKCGAGAVVIVCGPPETDAWSELVTVIRGNDARTTKIAIVPCIAGAARAASEYGVFDFIYDQARKPSSLLKIVSGERADLIGGERVTPDEVNGGRILLVEDSPANRLVAAAMLQKAGYTVEIAENGAEALQAVKRKRPDLVLMDLQMPVMNGYDATSAIRKLPGHVGRIPIVALTANVVAETEAADRGAKLDGFLSKPLSQAALLKTAGRWVGKQSSDMTHSRAARGATRLCHDKRSETESCVHHER